jgi:hypothetical protein
MDNNIQDDDRPPQMDEDQAQQICEALELNNCNKDTLEATILNLANGDVNLQYQIISDMVQAYGDPDGIADSLKEHLPETFNGDTQRVIDTFNNIMSNNMNNLPQQGGRRKRQTKRRKSKRRHYSKKRKTNRRRTTRRSRR